MPKSIFIVQSNAVPGREDEYNTWYNDVHLGDITALPGVDAAQRFRFADTQRGKDGPYPYEYIAIYELGGDPREVFDGIQHGKENGMVISDAMQTQRIAHLWLPISERVTPSE
ncbi:MAG: hypothetical protein QM714_06940 [Nocardioides sp.]|uniref:hypothetical protein n=1 Tax=Nocardioides sp. TaxID=35761 RepID=UPI0039E2AE87